MSDLSVAHVSDNPRSHVSENPQPFPMSALEGDAPLVAPQLLGALIRCGEVTLRVLETEAYMSTDPASHSFRGPTPRTEVMFGPPGRWYVYFTYGMHWCLNVVTGAEGDGQAVLIRGGIVASGIDEVVNRRFPNQTGTRRTNSRQLVDGPAKFAQGLGVTSWANGLSVHTPKGPTLLFDGLHLAVERVTTRVGVSKGVEIPWRFCAAGAARRAPDRSRT
jgi:DNA-3-methyladenine glycosylase